MAKDKNEGPDADFLHIESPNVSTVLSDAGRMTNFSLRFFEIRYMIDNKFIQEVEGKWGVLPGRIDVAIAFIDYVKLMGAADV